MDDTRKPLLTILGPVLGALLLLWTINLGVNQLRHTQEEIKQAARQERQLQAAQPADEAVSATDEITATEALTAAEEVTDAEPVTATESVTAETGLTETTEITETGVLTEAEPAATEP